MDVLILSQCCLILVKILTVMQSRTRTELLCDCVIGACEYYSARYDDRYQLSLDLDQRYISKDRDLLKQAAEAKQHIA